MRFEALIFDLDGTLADTLRDIADAVNDVLAEAGLPIHTTEAYKAFIGDGARRLMLRAVPASEVHRVDALVERYRVRYADALVVHSRPFEGVEAMLDALQTAQVPMAVLSNKPHTLTEGVVATLFPKTRFNGVFGQRDGIPRKPDPTVALQLMASMDVQPDRCAMVGDTHFDMRTAAAAGMGSVGVLWGCDTAEELRAAGAEVLIEHPSDLLPLCPIPGGVRA